MAHPEPLSHSSSNIDRSLTDVSDKSVVREEHRAQLEEGEGTCLSKSDRQSSRRICTHLFLVEFGSSRASVGGFRGLDEEAKRNKSISMATKGNGKCGFCY